MNTVVSSSWPRITASIRSGIHLTPRLVLGLAVAVIVLAIAYRVSLRLRPHVTGKVRGAFFTWARDFCPKCDGHGIVPRLGTCLPGAANRPRAPRKTTW